MILITEAASGLGRMVAYILAEQHGLPTRLFARSPHGAPTFERTHVVAGDYADPAVLECAFAGIETALIAFDSMGWGQHERVNDDAIEAARRAGVAHLVYVSRQGAAPDSTCALARDHHKTEELLERSGIPFATLRTNLYLDDLRYLFFGGDVARGAAGEGAARVVTMALRRPDVVRGVVDVTGPEALTLAEVASRLSAIHGRPFRYEEESLAEFRARRERLDEIESLLEAKWDLSYEPVASGELAAVSLAVARFTGHPAKPLESELTRGT